MPVSRLLEIMAKLRDRDGGCPWDLEQTFATIAPYTIEEAYEVAEAIARGDLEDLRDELGDLLLQVVFHARMAEEAGAFDFGDVVHAITSKLLRRHPHVFGDAGALPVGAVNELWDRIKAEEKRARACPSAATIACPTRAGISRSREPHTTRVGRGNESMRLRSASKRKSRSTRRSTCPKAGSATGA